MSTTTIMDLYQTTKNDDGFNSDEGIETLSSSPTSNTSIISSTSDHGSLENVIDDEDDDDENCHNLNDDDKYNHRNQHVNDDDDEDDENYDNENDDDYDDEEDEEDEVAVNVAGSKRLAVLSFEQVSKLNEVMNDTVSIHGRGNFPTLEVTLKDLVALVRKKLELDVQFGGAGMLVQDIRLNGGAASHVLSSENQSYNDLDLIFAIEFSSNRHFDRVKSAVLNVLLDLLPEGVSRRRMMPCSLKEAYVGKMVKVNNSNDCDKWSLISLGNSPGHKNVELKFVDTMRRQFEFSVDSFQIQLDSLLLFYECAALPISENFYPTVVGESVYGDFQEALYHLENKLIATRNPEEIRGGGLLKYCNLLVRNYKPVDSERIKTLERYMCSRFFIDFPDLGTQNIKLEAYLRNHFWETDEENLQYQYLMHLKQVVENSTVCLMGHERRQTLSSIQSLAMQILCREHQKQRIQHQDKLRRHTIVIQQHQQQQQQHQQQQQQQQQQQSQQLHMQQQSQSHPQQTTEQQQQSQQPHLIQIATPEQLQQLQTVTVTTTTATSTDHQQQQQPTTTTIQIASCTPSFIYANGIYYASVIPTTICTCPATWLSAT